ncbi:DUF4352 domain-containing protein [Nocardia anaemiae]|uniref:DUF4352 domain-containing protein n=1 Tax=Nocardia anaemiae TaxID=263910 RepID=UPI0007A4C305|nr:DUF4352 domain-containing protein [Nocardia anaemiae]
MSMQPPPPPYGQYPPSGPYPPQPPKKRAIWPWIVIGAIVLLCGGCFGIVGIAANSSKDTASSAASDGSAANAKGGGSAAALGAEVRDGKFGFVVNNVEVGVKTAGTNQFLKKDAQGQYILVHVTVSNTSNKPQSYFGSNQKLFDTQGRQFTNDTAAEINVNDHSVIGTDINPGNKIEVTIAFDVPVDAVPATIEFHDSAFSGGAKASLK